MHPMPRANYVSGLRREQMRIRIPRESSRTLNEDNEEARHEMQGLSDMSAVQGRLFRTSLSRERKSMQKMPTGKDDV